MGKRSKKSKKNWIMLFVIIIMIIGMIAVFELKIFKEDEEPTNINSEIDIVPESDIGNMIEGETRLEQIKNNTNDNTTNEETESEQNETNNNNTLSGPIDTEEKAIELVKQNWGEDDTVYFVSDGKDADGNYIICVREKTTTRALYWYSVNYQDGTLTVQ